MPSGELRDMDRLPTRIDRNSEDFNRRRDFNIQLVDELKQKINVVKEGGGENMSTVIVVEENYLLEKG